GLVVEPVDMRVGRRRRGWRTVGIGGRGCSSLRGATCDLAEPLVVDAVRDCDAGAAVALDGELDDDVVDQRRLVDLRLRETREPRLFVVDDDLRPVSLGVAESRFGDVERAQALAPTSTLRKRAGGAPCETCAS